MNQQRPTLTLEDLEPGMRVRVRHINGVWWHPGANRWDGQVVTVLAHEEDPSKIWSDPMAGGVFYAEEAPAYGFSVRSICEVVARPERKPVRLDYLPQLPEQMRTLPGAALERDFAPEVGDKLRVPERLYNGACKARLVNHPDMKLSIAEVKPVAWIVRFDQDPNWWHTRGFLPDFEEVAARQQEPPAEPEGEVEATELEPKAEVEATEPEAEVEATEPEAEDEPTQPQPEVEATEPAAEAEATEPKAEVEATEPKAEVEATEPAAKAQTTEPEAEVEQPPVQQPGGAATPEQLTAAPVPGQLTAPPAPELLTAPPAAEQLTAAPAPEQLTAPPAPEQIEAAPAAKQLGPAEEAPQLAAPADPEPPAPGQA